jgi:hypothetical protein
MQGFFSKHGSKLVLGLAGTGIAGYAIHKGYQIRQNGVITLFSPPPESETYQKIGNIKAKGSVYSKISGKNAHQEIGNIETDSKVKSYNKGETEEKKVPQPS